MEVAVAPAAALSCAPSPSPTKAGHAHTHPRRARASTSSAGTTPSPSSPPRSALLVRRVSKPELKHPLFALPAAPSPPYPSLSSSYSSSALSLLYTSAAGDPHAHASLGMSPATATGTVRAPRVPPFVPLTPIMASPRLTPEIGARTRGADRAPGEGVEADYLNRGGAHAVLLPLRHSLSCDSAEASGRGAAAAMPSPPLPSFAPPPTWTSTPPTPPAKHASELPWPLGSRSSSRGRSAKGPRPASVAVVPTASAIASLTYTSSSSTSLASSVTVRGRLPFPPSAGDAKTGPRSRRRMSLPPSLAERMPAPHGPLTGTAASSPVRVGRALRDWERAASPLRAAVVRERGSVRKLFTVGDADGSEGEEGQPSTARRRSGSVGTRRSRASTRREQAVASEMQEQAEGEVCRDSEDEPEEEEEEEEDTEREVKLGDEAAREQEVEELRRANAATEADVERMRVRTRRYHALMELLATEAGYLTDLRALVTVYLEQLPMLSTTTPPSPAMRPSLALVRNLPSSRSSFLHPSPTPSPSPSAGSHLGSESGHGPPKDKDKDKGHERERSGDKKGDKDKAKAKEYGLRKSKGKDKGKGRDVGLEHDVERDKIGANVDHEEAVEDVGRAAHAHEPQQHRRGTLDAEPVSHGHAAAKGKHARRAILLDGDVRAVCRNARELLEFHERLVEELHGVVAPYGLSSMFDAHGRDGKAPGGAHEIPEESTLEHVDDAVSVVAEMFVSQAPSFSIYEAFCAGHNEAADLVRRIQEVYSVEWDAYEQRCSLLIAHAFDLDAQRASPESRSEGHGMTPGDNAGLPASATTSSQLSPRLIETMRKKRRHSTSSLAMLSSPPLFDNMPHMVPGARSAPTEGGHSSSSSTHGHGRTSSQAHAQATRLKLLDYLIKPVQRICKYPLLLDQLRNRRARTQSAVDSSTRPSMRADVGEYELGLAAVDRAGEAMRLVVGLVNRASDLRVQITRSALIWSRMLLTNPPVSQSPPSPPAGLTHEFVASLGACHLAGALDVVHHPSVLHMPSGGLKAKYYGAFLYMGGYLILVKIPKGGKVYEPRFWLSLVGFDVFDLEEEDVSLPHSFHLCGHGHHLQLAAACQPEKAIWMSAIQEVLSVTPHWTNEPMSSLQAGEKPDATSPVDDAPAEWTATHLPTIQSLSDLESQGDEPNPAAPARPKSRLDNRSRPPSRMDCISFRQDPQTPTSFSALTRRSSSASVKAFFSPMTLDPTTRIARPSSQVRQHVDQGLRDVFSQNCVAARSQALLREEELFHARKKTTMSRSNSGLSITGAMTLAAKRRYDSVLVSRRKGSVDVPADQLNDLDDGGKNLATLSRRAKSLASRRRKKPLPSIVPMVASELSKVESEAEADIPASQSPAALLESPFAASQCSSNTSSNAESVLPSPVDLMGPLLGNVISEGTIRQTDVVVVTGEEFRPKRTRSMVDNVKYFFHSRPASPCSSSGHPSPSSTPPALVPQEHDTWREPPGGFVHWWRKGSLRRRVQSSPDMPGDDGQPAVPGRASADSCGSFLVKVQPSTTAEESSSSTPEPGEKSPGNSRRVAFNDSLPTRRRSLFVPSSRQRDPSSSPQVTPDASPSSTARRSLRNMWRFQRSNSFTPMDMSKPKA